MKQHYSKKVIENFIKPQNMGELKNPDAIGKIGNAKCGDVMELQIKLDSTKKKIKNIKFKTFGCAAAIASTSMLTQIAKGKTLKQARNLTMKDVAKKLGGLPPLKLHCSNMAVKALNKAIDNLKDGK